ncbi:HDIG domain-containing metalloprotein [Paramaledivibacter caminithermalis]|jgi:putative nucleotidyltransferase with HDIG domain|uniref:HDIG domain-containing protein n=1 Tax=Paramaledivibacter caminithermalis (strain DSM 15212 / CIP 107654 / DViRD3) TaxID=1121301 RepID=A0A1M6R413_PARC5|nr:HDIG domain-containing metalloprotein [Paramaledivibacter caminithermalis]SHK27140.1 HDIG domain-containing protein [Paramaledivibacter caminithermalis DSM 15212]
MEMNRENAFNLLNEYVDSDSLLKHCLAVEASMIGYAKKFGQDVETWASCGLLHDIDFEKYPDEHPLRGAEILKDKGYPEDFIMAVKGHADYTNTPRETQMAKTLYAVDELSSFVIACALVRPNKFEGLKVKSVKKKLKDKAFAKAVDREQIKRSAEELGVDLTEHIQTVIDSLIQREDELSQIGMSLIK